jgi:glycosyltransferase involved in cell wall biosynthesis
MIPGVVHVPPQSRARTLALPSVVQNHMVQYPRRLPVGRQLHVLRWGTYDSSKPRTRILHDGLCAVGASVRDCHAPLWEGIPDKSQVVGLGRFRQLARWLATYPVLAWRFLRTQRPDMVLVGYPGILDVIVVAPLARLRGVPIVWDMFMSAYDTIVLDRRMLPATGFRARLLYLLERLAIRRSDAVFLDTEAHARRIESLYRLPERQCGTVWVGAEIERFRLPEPESPPARVSRSALKVLFYGQFIPLHGIDTIVRAARRMSNDNVEWTLIGRGQESGAIRQMLDEMPLPRLRWIEWVDYGELRRWIAEADVCLGIFGTSGKAASVIPNKVFQIVAAGRPLITCDSPAIRELLSPDPPCVHLVPAGDASALTEAVRDHLTQRPSAERRRCHAALCDRIAAPAIGRQFMESVVSRLGLAEPVRTK